MNKSIALLICYIGPWPWYFPYFLHSCKYNPSIRFILITDNPCPAGLPDNITIVHQTLDDIRELAKKKLDLSVTIDSPYKLCDLKPAYGAIFSEHIRGYDFWGHGDIDVIYGNIRNFMTEDLLDEYDVLSMRHDFLTGYFQLFRNTEKMVTLYTKSKDFIKVFTTPRHFCFDETNFHFEEFTHEIHYSKIHSEVESMTHLIKRLAEEKYLKAHFNFFVIEGTPGKLIWHAGKLVYKRKFEAILYHLIKLKTIYTPSAVPSVLPDKFFISPSRIYF